jgi:recombination protein RecA
MSKLAAKLKKYRESQLVYAASDTEYFVVKRIPTSILVMDILTGGGIPVSRVTELYGAKSSGKSTTILRIIGNYLKLNPKSKALLADFEATYEESWGSHFVIDLSRLLVLVPDYGEQGVDVVKDFASESEIGLIAVDSVANLIPLREAESEAGDATVGLQAKLLNRLYRLLFPLMIARRKTDTPLTILVANQLRANIGGRKFQSPTIKPGGMMQDFLYSLDIRFYTIELKKVGSLPVKSVHQFTIEKNKLGLYKRSGEFRMNLVDIDGHSSVGSLDEIDTLMEFGKKSGIILRSGNKWLIEEKSYPNLESVQAALVTDSKLYEVTREKTLQACIRDVRLTTSDGDKGETDG